MPKRFKFELHIRREYFIFRLYTYGYMTVCIRLWGRKNYEWLWYDHRKNILTGKWII